MEYFVQSDRVRDAFEEVKGLLAGKTSMACMGDMLTLAAFSHAIPINNSLLGAYTTEREALRLVRISSLICCISRNS